MAVRNSGPWRWLSEAPELITPYEDAPDLSAETAIICNVGGFFECLRKDPEFIDSRRTPRIGGSMCRGLQHRDIVVYKVMVGAPAATLVMEALIGSGVTKIVFLGLAGSMTEDCRIGDAVVPSWGLREEGTSFHYLTPSAIPRPSKRLAEGLVKAVGRQKVKRGGVWTTDAPYRETRDKIRRYARKGVVAVDMECTALMSVAMMRKVEFAAALAISDTVHGETWEVGFDSKELAKAVPPMSRAAVKALRS